VLEAMDCTGALLLALLLRNMVTMAFAGIENEKQIEF
jgi:hypothetical protein